MLRCLVCNKVFEQDNMVCPECPVTFLSEIIDLAVRYQRGDFLPTETYACTLDFSLLLREDKLKFIRHLIHTNKINEGVGEVTFLKDLELPELPIPEVLTKKEKANLIWKKKYYKAGV